MTEEKKFEDIDPKELKIEFAPGCFDQFEGTQEELDELMEELTRMLKSGELQEKARPIDFENPTDEDLDAIEHLMEISENLEKRNLQ